MLNETVYSEPLLAVSKPQLLYCVSLADVDRLPKVSDNRPDDAIVDCPTIGRQRLSLYLFITASGATALDTGALIVTFGDFFAIQLIMGAPPQNDIAPGANRVVVVRDGFYPEQQIAQDQALILFHQKLTGAKKIVYWEKANKQFRVIFPVPMRVPPKLSVTFADPTLEAVPKAPLIRNTATAELRFKVRGKGGILPEPAEITNLLLDSEL